MVAEIDGVRKLLIVALPNGVINKIEPRYDPKGLVTKDTYLEESFYTYPYRDYDESTSSSDYSNTQSANEIKDYYVTNFNGNFDSDGYLYYNYLGYNFKVIFGSTHFVIKYNGRA